MAFFRDIIGHVRPIATLQSMLKRDEIPPALLFVGEGGIGKKTVASIFAQALLCSGKERSISSVKGEGEWMEPCGQCLPCQKIQNRNHPDFYTIEPEWDDAKGKMKDEIAIGQIRAMQEQMVFRPMDGARKILLIDSAEKMNLAAANSLLKTIEEPPLYAVVILIASSAESLPATIPSRCQKISFPSLGASQLEALLMEKNGFTLHQARLVAVLAGGNLGVALATNIEEALKKEETLNAVVSERGLARYETLFEMATVFSRNDTVMDECLHYLLSWFRDVLLLQALDNPDQVISAWLLHADRMTEIRKWSEKMNDQAASRMITLIREIQRARSRNINRQLALETLFIELKNTMTPVEV